MCQPPPVSTGSIPVVRAWLCVGAHVFVAKPVPNLRNGCFSETHPGLWAAHSAATVGPRISEELFRFLKCARMDGPPVQRDPWDSVWFCGAMGGGTW